MDQLKTLCRHGLQGDREDQRVFKTFLSFLNTPLYGLTLGSESRCIHAELWCEEEEMDGESRGVVLKIWIAAQYWEYTDERLLMFENNLGDLFNHAKEIRNLDFDQVRVMWLVSVEGETSSPRGAIFSHYNGREPLLNSVRSFPAGMLSLGWFADEQAEAPWEWWSELLDRAKEAEAEGQLIYAPLSN
ncbi:hypothetical protein CIB48_g11246 [Xylaria polymorpha]|nr:hypothetical protein CIB48_g11246 [Xylaria polymorpha]